MSNLDYRLFRRRRLPHLQPAGAVLFVTFRLAGSLPAEAIQRLHDEARRREAQIERIADPQERAREAYQLNRLLFGKWDRALDANSKGPRWLQAPRVAALVCDSLRWRDGAVYDLHAYCVMPNHVHAVFQPLVADNGREHALPAIMHSLKGHTARAANRALGRTGSFWQHESYDHVVRSDEEGRRIIEYVLNNPVAAGLARRKEEWQWSYSKWGL